MLQAGQHINHYHLSLDCSLFHIMNPTVSYLTQIIPISSVSPLLRVFQDFVQFSGQFLDSLHQLCSHASELG